MRTVMNGSLVFDTTTPADVAATAQAGTATFAAHRDHVHRLDITGLTEDTTPDWAADFIPSYDVSAAINKKVHPNPAALDVVTAETTVGPSDNTEKTMLTYALPANTLGTNGLLRIMPFFWHLNNSGSGNTWTLKVKLGATTLITMAFSTPTNASRRLLSPIIYIKGDGATNAQEAFCTMLATVDSAASAGLQGAHGTGAEDTTTNLNLVITVTNSLNNANVETTLMHSTVELLRAM